MAKEEMICRIIRFITQKPSNKKLVVDVNEFFSF